MNTNTFTGVGPWSSYLDTEVFAVNNNGWLGGTALGGSGETLAVEWQGSSTGWVMLPTWSGNSGYSNDNYLEAMDSAGDAVGYTTAPSNHPIYYNYASNTMVELSVAGKAYAINDNGLMVGGSSSQALRRLRCGRDPRHDPAAQQLDCPEDRLNLEWAKAVDNSGDIVGYGTIGGATDGFLLGARAAGRREPRRPARTSTT